MAAKKQKLVGNMIIAQSGGPTVVINQSLVGALHEVTDALQSARSLDQQIDSSRRWNRMPRRSKPCKQNRRTIWPQL